MPRLSQRTLSCMLLVLACTSALNPSVFLTHEEYASLMQSREDITCSWSTLEAGEYRNGSETYTLAHVDNVLSSHTFDHLTTSKLKTHLKSRLIENSTIPISNDGFQHRGRPLHHVRIGRQYFWDTQFHAMIEQHKHASLSSSSTQSSLTVLGMTTPTDLICLELSLIERTINVVLPIRTPVMLRLQRRHSRDFLESHFGAIFAFSLPDTIVMLSNKSHFHSWMDKHQFERFMPNTYQTPSEAKYPCLVKATNLGLGEGVYLANNRSELDAAIRAEGMQSYFMTEAILGSVKHCIFFVAHQGRSVAYLTHITKHDGDLFIDGSKLRVPSQLVSTADLVVISPAYSVLKEIVRETQFTGFGCIEFKLVPDAWSEGQISDYINNLAPVGNATDAIFTNFDLLSDVTIKIDYPATPKFFEVNSRLCHSLHNTWVPAFYEMTKLFVRSIVDDNS